MNEKTNLRDDFYSYINHDWIQTTKMPLDKARFSLDDELNEKIEKFLRYQVNAWKVKPSKIANYAKIQEFLKFYNLMTNFEARKKHHYLPLQGLLADILTLKSFDDLSQFYERFSYYGLALPFTISLMPSLENSSFYTFSLDEMSLILPDKSYYQDEKLHQKYITIFKERTIELLRKFAFSKSEASRLVDEAIAFDKLLVAYSYSSEESVDYLKHYKKLTPEEYRNLYPYLDLTNFIEVTSKQKAQTINHFNSPYFDNLKTLFCEANFVNYRSLLAITTIYKYSQFLSTKIAFLADKFRLEIKGIKKSPSHLKQAFLTSLDFFDMPVGVYYAHRKFNFEIKKQIAEMTDKIVAIYKAKIQATTWMQAETKIEAIKKLDNLKYEIGLPKMIEPYYDDLKVVENRRYSLIESVYHFETIIAKYYFSQYGQKTENQFWQMTPAVSNAYYDDSENKIVFPAGILQAPFFSLLQTMSQNYGAFGATIGHEISHAFDKNGAEFDHLGNLRNWWTEEDKVKFDKIVQKVSDLYNQEMTVYGKANGKLTASENFADMIGLEASYEAIKDEKDFNLQEFFNAYAVSWRNIITPEEATYRLSNDVHSLGILRTNVVLKNFAPFQEYYQIKEQDKMYLAPEKRIKLWT